MSDRESKNPRPMPICSAKKVSIRLRIVSNLVNHFLYNELYKYQKLCVSAIWYWLFQFLLNIAKPNLSLMSVEQGYGRIMMLRKWFTDFKHCYIYKKLICQSRFIDCFMKQKQVTSSPFWMIDCVDVKELPIFQCSNLIKYFGSTRFGNGGVLPSWIDTGIWSMPNERYTYRGLRTDLGKILSVWPFENSTTHCAFGP